MYCLLLGHGIFLCILYFSFYSFNELHLSRQGVGSASALESLNNPGRVC